MGIPREMKRAVFLDRDGVINASCGKDQFGKPDSPLNEKDLKIFPFVGKCIKTLNELGFLVFVVTNQPAVAKGKMSLDDLAQIHALIYHHIFKEGGNLKRIYTCLHHPDPCQVVFKEFLLKDCDCRKPKSGLIFQARDDYKIDLLNSWMIGDSWKDIEAGKKAGCQTIYIASNDDVSVNANFMAKNLEEATRIIRYSVEMKGVRDVSTK